VETVMAGKRIRFALLAALVAAGALVATAPSSAATLNGIRDARYCEIFTVVTSPSPVATVWNTLGLNACPAPWWDNLDTSRLAQEHHVPVVVLNGPRHFVVDGVSVPKLGPVSTFDGQQLRKVAKVNLSQTGGGAPPAYTTIRIARVNTWRYAKGKLLFDLIDPSGRVYRMQAYSQQVDPSLTYAQLAHLGSRLSLPDGWRYRVSTAKHTVKLKARGSATVLQDNLEDTYQRLPAR
jgi:hypothetical protein